MRGLLEADNARRDLNAHANDPKYLEDVDKLYTEKKANIDALSLGVASRAAVA
jgi:hypothetical protein